MNVDVLYITYNQRQYVKSALESIFMQRVGDDVNVRILVADDYSTDGAREEISACLSTSPFPYTVIDNGRNLGLGDNYASAFEHSTGDYIVVLEGDDCWTSPYHIEQHIRFLDEHRECGMSMNRFCVLHVDSHIVYPVVHKHEDGVVYYNLREQIVANRLGNLSACCFRGKILRDYANKLYGMSYADWLLGIISAQDGLVAILPESTSLYRRISNSQWSGLSNKKQVEWVIKACDIYDCFFDKRYNAYFRESKAYHKSVFNRSYKTRDWIPAFAIQLAKWIIPINVRLMIRRMK